MAIHPTRRISPMLKFLTLALVVAVASAIVVPKIESRDLTEDLGIMLAMVFLVGAMRCLAKLEEYYTNRNRGGKVNRNGDGDSHGNDHSHDAHWARHVVRQVGVMLAGSSSGAIPAQPPDHAGLCSTPTSLGLDRFQECFDIFQSDTAVVKSLGNAIKANGHLDKLSGIVDSADSFASMRESLVPFISDYANIVPPDSPFIQCIISKSV